MLTDYISMHNVTTNSDISNTPPSFATYSELAHKTLMFAT